MRVLMVDQQLVTAVQLGILEAVGQGARPCGE